MIRIRKHGSVIASFATPQEIVISHANDSIRVGDGTDLMGPLQNVGGVLSYPVKLMSLQAGHGLALDATLTGGTQRAKITDGTDNAGITDVGGAKALKVDVISTVGGGAAPAFTDDAAFTVGVTQCTPIGAMFDDVATDSVDEGDVGVVRMTADRLLKMQIAGIASGVAIPITDNAGSLTVDGTFWQATQPVSHANLDAALSTLATHAKQDTQTTALQLIDDVIFVDDAAFTPATSKVAVVGGVYQATPNALDDGDAGAPLLDANHRLDVVVNASALPSGAATAANQSTEITALQLIDDVVYADDAAFTTATSKGIAVMGNYKATVDAVDDGDVGALHMTARRALHASLRYESTGNQIIGGQTSADSIPVVIASDQVAVFTKGNAAHDAGVSGNPHRIAGRAMLANGTAVAEDDTCDIATDNQGRIITTPHCPRDLVTQVTGSIASTTEATMITAGAAGVFLDLTHLTITNASATATRVQIRDATAGTIRMEIALAANSGAVLDFSAVPFKQTTAANNWTIDLSAAVTSIYYVAQAVSRIA